MSGGWVELALGRATVRFTDRHGGESVGSYRSLNLGANQGDDPELVDRNRSRAIAGSHCNRIVAMDQVHGNEAMVVDSSTPSPAGQCDALLTRERGIALLAVTADCLPVVLSVPGAVAVVHAGWRGLAAGVIERTVELLGEAGDGQARAAVGPAAGVCCYEVSEDVIAAFAGSAVNEGRMLDLAATAVGKLAAAGVGEPVLVPGCTICDRDGRYFSHRRDAAPTGRQGVVAWLNS